MTATSSMDAVQATVMECSEVSVTWTSDGCEGGMPSHTPAPQCPSVHSVPSGWTASTGHVALVPVQSSVTSHSPVASRHTSVDDAKLFAGQSLLVPSQLAATSQAPWAER